MCVLCVLAITTCVLSGICFIPPPPLFSKVKSRLTIHLPMWPVPPLLVAIPCSSILLLDNLPILLNQAIPHKIQPIPLLDMLHSHLTAHNKYYCYEDTLYYCSYAPVFIYIGTRNSCWCCYSNAFTMAC